MAKTENDIQNMKIHFGSQSKIDLDQVGTNDLIAITKTTANKFLATDSNGEIVLEDKIVLSELGDNTTPIFINEDNEFEDCLKYAGATKIILNGTSKGGEQISIYAPTSAGTSGQFLVANASGVPTWETKTIPTKVSDLTNDSGFLTLATLPIWDGDIE